MSCLAEERFVELLDQGGLDATKPEEQTHLATCEACREAWATVAAAGEVLSEARPRATGRAARWIPLAAAAAMLLAIIAAIAVRKTPSPVTTPQKDPMALFLEGTAEEAKAGREALLRSGRKALPGLAAARPRFKGAAKLQAIQALMWDIKVAAAQQDRDQAEIVKKLDTMKVDLAFENTRFEDILTFMRDFSALNLVLDPTIEPGEVQKFSMQNSPLRQCLDVLCAVKDLDFDLKYGVVFISRPLRLWSTEPGVGLPDANAWTRQDLQGEALAAGEKLRSIRITIDMQSAPLSAVVDYLQEISKLSFKVEGENAEQPVSLKVQDVTLPHMLELLTLPRGRDLRFENGAFLLTETKKK